MGIEIHDKENLIYILENSKKAIEDRDIAFLKELSNRTVHSASIYQDEYSITVAVIIYTMYKIFARPDYEKYKDWPLFLKIVNSRIENSIKDLREDDFKAFEEDILAIRKIVAKLSGNFKRYVDDVFRTAMISKASRIYEHGVSMEQTASLLGITLFELAEYAGKTGISDVDLNVTIDIEKRLKKAMGFFR